MKLKEDIKVRLKNDIGKHANLTLFKLIKRNGFYV